MYRALRQLYGKANYLVILALILLLLLLIRCKISQNDDSSIIKTRRNYGKPKIQCYMFLLILTSPKGELRRKAMRETWLTSKVKEMLIERRFVIGTAGLSSITKKTLNDEQSKHSDLLFLENFKDSYYKLTEKLLRTLVWVNDNVNAKFVMKVDDDTFVRTNKLIPSLHKRLPLGRIYWGFFRGNSNVKKTGSWKEVKWFLSDHYLPYALGGGYVVSMDLVEYISANANYLSLYNSEDISLGVWLSSIKTNRIHDTRFDTEYKSKGCNNAHVVSHKQQPEDMYAKQNQLSNHERLCKKETEVLLTYDYDWQAPPSRCCKRVSISKLATEY